MELLLLAALPSGGRWVGVGISTRQSLSHPRPRQQQPQRSTESHQNRNMVTSPVFLLTKRLSQGSESLVAQWLNLCPAAKTELTTWGSIRGSLLKVDLAFYPSEVRLPSLLGGGQCVASTINL